MRRTDFYSLAKGSLVYLYCACTISFRSKYFAFRREKALVESGLIQVYYKANFPTQNGKLPIIPCALKVYNFWWFKRKVKLSYNSNFSITDYISNQVMSSTIVSFFKSKSKCTLLADHANKNDYDRKDWNWPRSLASLFELEFSLQIYIWSTWSLMLIMDYNLLGWTRNPRWIWSQRRAWAQGRNATMPALP